MSQSRFRWLGPITILVLGVLSGTLWLFLKLASEIAEGEADAFDRAIMMALRVPGDPTQPVGSPALEDAMRDVTSLGGVVVVPLISIGVALVLLCLRRWRACLVLLGIVSLASITSELTKAFFNRDRPDFLARDVFVQSASYPSGHSTLAATTYLLIAIIIARSPLPRPVKVLVIVLAIAMLALIGFSRVYLGAHWPTDVLGGLCLGCFWAIAGWVMLARFETQPA